MHHEKGTNDMTRATLVLVVSMLLSGALAPAARAQVADFEPVTTEELLAPDDGDWLNWRRTLNGQGYSPLDQIDRDNVGDLQLVWSWAMQPGTDEVTPLVRDGVMFMPSRSGVQALDAATGDLLWDYSRRQGVPEDEDLPINRRPGMARRSIAIYGDSDLRRHEPGRAHRPRRADGRAGLAAPGGRQQPRLPVHQRPDRRAGQGESRG